MIIVHMKYGKNINLHNKKQNRTKRKYNNYFEKDEGKGEVGWSST